MTKKKKTTAKTSRISPTVPTTNPDAIQYDDLADGECFILGGRLLIKQDVCDQEAIDLNGGGYLEDLCGKIVIPVDIKVTWKKK